MGGERLEVFRAKRRMRTMSQSAERTALATDRTRVETRKRAQKNIHRAFDRRSLSSSVFFLDHRHFTRVVSKKRERENSWIKLGGR
jgi:hypothetical protein